MPPRLKLPALALADTADDDGRCWPSIATLCKKTGQSERTMQAAIAELEAAGVVTRNERPGRSTIYVINPLAYTPAESAPLPTPAGFAPPPPQDLRGTPAESAPRTIKEPSFEPSRGLGADAPQAAPPPPKRNGHRIGYDYETKAFTGITEADRLRWQEAYPCISVPDEIAKLAVWLGAGRRKKQIEQFIVRNLTRANDRKDR